MARFRGKLVRWGNSVGINLPKPIRDSLNLNVGDEVEITDKEDYVILKRNGKDRNFSWK